MYIKTNLNQSILTSASVFISGQKDSGIGQKPEGLPLWAGLGTQIILRQLCQALLGAVGGRGMELGVCGLPPFWSMWPSMPPPPPPPNPLSPLPPPLVSALFCWFSLSTSITSGASFPAGEMVFRKMHYQLHWNGTSGSLMERKHGEKERERRGRNKQK